VTSLNQASFTDNDHNGSTTGDKLFYGGSAATNSITATPGTKTVYVALYNPANGRAYSSSYVIATFTITVNTTGGGTTNPGNTYTVSYNANGGAGAPANQTKTQNVALTLSSTRPTRSGYTFLGWATSSTATSVAYQPGASYTANASITFYAVWQAAAPSGGTQDSFPTIQYSTTPGSYIFVNQPEDLISNHLADASLGNNLLYQGNVSGVSQIYFQHRNLSGRTIKYGIQFYNTSSQPITLKTYNRGGSYGWAVQDETWRPYFASSAATIYTIQPGSGKWFYLGRTSGSLTSEGVATLVDDYSKAIGIAPSECPFDGVMKFEVVSGTLLVNAMAGVNLQVLSGYATQKYALSGDLNRIGVKTSTSNVFPWITSNLTWNVSDSTPSGNLPVTVNGSRKSSWITNITRNESPENNAVILDMLTMTSVRGDVTRPRLNEVWYDWANWGVLYRNTFTIRNNGTRPRTVTYQIKGNGQGSYIGVYSNQAPTRGFRAMKWEDVSYGRDSRGWLLGYQDVATVTIPAGQRVEFNADHVLGGMAYNGVEHRMVIN